MRQFHGLKGSVNDQGGTEPGAQAQKQHFAPAITSQSLHGGIVGYFDGAFESAFEIKANPAGAEIPRLGERTVMDDRPGKSHGNGVVLPVGHQRPHLGHHHLGRHFGAGFKLAMSFFAGGQNFDVSSADIDDQYIHDENSTG